MNFVIEFDGRPDNGPRLVGPFPNRQFATDHVGRLLEGWPPSGELVSWSVAPLASPVESARPRTPAPEGGSSTR